MKQYNVYRNEQAVGSVEMETQGLYYLIRCFCEPCDDMVRLIDKCEKGDVAIGICGPAAWGYGIERKVPLKKLGSNGHTFRLENIHRTKEAFFTIQQNGEFELPEDLEKCRFSLREGIAGLVPME